MQPKKKTRKMRHTSNRFILHSARERVTENRSKFQWALPGATLCQMKGQVNYITTVLRPVMVTGQTQPADGRRRKTTGSRPTVAKITTQYQAGGKKKKQKSETRQVCIPCTKTRRTKPMAGTLEQMANTTTRILARTKNRAR